MLIKDAFGWPDQEIREMGKTAPKFCLIVKFIFKIFAPLKKLVKEIPGYWEEHYTVGKLEVVKFDEQNKELVIRLREIKAHPIFCLYLEGYFERVIMFVERSVTVLETKCMFKEGPQHEYEFKW